MGRTTTARSVAVVGLDLSLTRSAACYVPPGWEPGDWDSLEFVTAGFEVKGRDPAACARRLSVVANVMFEFVHWRVQQARSDELHVFLEDHAYGIGQSNIVTAELVGCVKRDLYERLGIVALPVNQSTARKLLLGKLPPRERGSAVAVALKAAGWPHRGSDVGDAFVVANAGRSDLGMVAVVLA